MWPSCFHLVPLYLKGNNVLLILSVVACFYSFHRALFKGKTVNTCTLILYLPFRFSSPHASLVWMDGECSRTLGAGCCLCLAAGWVLDGLCRLWVSTNAVGGEGRSSLRVAAGLCPVEKVPEPDAHLFKLKNKIQIKLKMLETKIYPLQKPLTCYWFLSIFIPSGFFFLHCESQPGKLVIFLLLRTKKSS